MVIDLGAELSGFGGESNDSASVRSQKFELSSLDMGNEDFGGGEGFDFGEIFDGTI
jgi:hypothetical protein